MVHAHIDRQSVLILIAAFLICLIDGIDGSIVNIALPAIAESFGTDTGTVSWTGLAYLIAVAGTIFIFGNIAARNWVKKLIILGFGIFTLASVICGFAPVFIVLVLARFIQGIGAAMLVACAPILCIKYLPRSVTGLAFGIMASASAAGFAFGPAIGSIITNFLSWNWIFWVNLPIGILCILYSFKAIPADKKDKSITLHHSFDLTGAIALFIGITLGAYALERVSHLGFSNPVILITGLAGIAILVYFVIHSGKTRNPILNVSVFRVVPVTFMTITYMIIQTILSGTLFLLPFYFLNQFGAGTLLCGVLLLIQPVITAVTGFMFGKWSDNYGRRVFCVISCLIYAGIMAVFAWVNPSAGLLPFVITLAIYGICTSMACGPIPSQLVDQMPEGERETGSTIQMAAIYIGAVFGVALYATLFTMMTSESGMVPVYTELSQELFLSGFQAAMIAGIIMSLIAAVLSFAVRDKR